MNALTVCKFKYYFLIIKIKIVKLFNPPNYIPNDKPKKQLLKGIKPYPMLRKWQHSKPIERLKVLQLLQVFSLVKIKLY